MPAPLAIPRSHSIYRSTPTLWSRPPFHAGQPASPTFLVEALARRQPTESAESQRRRSASSPGSPTASTDLVEFYGEGGP